MMKGQSPVLKSQYEFAIAPFHSTASSSSPLDWWRTRQENKEADKYKERIISMASKEAWTLNDMTKELDEVVNSWSAKVPGINNNKEIEMAKQMHKTVKGIIAVVGEEADSDKVQSMNRIDRLKAAAAGGMSVSEIKTLQEQFASMGIMHKVLRNRKSAGKSLPETAEAMHAIVQAEGSKLLSKEQKKKMVKFQGQKMRNAMRRR